MIACITTVLIGFSTPLTTHEKEVIEQLKPRCEANYGDNAPCLKKIVKRTDNIFEVTCGSKQEITND